VKKVIIKKKLHKKFSMSINKYLKKKEGLLSLLKIYDNFTCIYKIIHLLN